MKKTTLSSVFVMILTIACIGKLNAQACHKTPTCNHKKDSIFTNDSIKKSDTKTAIYQCPMHKEITSDKPGKCSKCGMNLGKIENSKKTEKAIYYTCPMHPEIKADKPGSCPKCGMTLEKNKKNIIL